MVDRRLDPLDRRVAVAAVRPCVGPRLAVEQNAAAAASSAVVSAFASVASDVVVVGFVAAAVDGASSFDLAAVVAAVASSYLQFRQGFEPFVDPSFGHWIQQ